MKLVYYSTRSGNTRRFACSVSSEAIEITDGIEVDGDFILVTPTYGAGPSAHGIPRPVMKFFATPTHVKNVKGVVGIGNRNFGVYFCEASRRLANRLGVDEIMRVEVFGTREDVQDLQDYMRKSNDCTS